MRGSVRQFAILTLAATYAVLSTCGSAWHLAHCADCCCIAADADTESQTSIRRQANCSSSHQRLDSKHCDCGHSHQNAPASEQPLPDAHDQSQCEICQLFAQSLTFVAVVSVEISPERVENSVCLIPLTVPECELIPATSRGPPMMA